MKPQGRATNVRQRIEAFLLKHIGEAVTNEQIRAAARDPVTGAEPENWHQRLSELRTDYGYAILTHRDRADLRPGQYLMPTPDRRPGASGRVRPAGATWKAVLARAAGGCEWEMGGVRCGLKTGEADPVGGGTVRLTPDHVTPHSIHPGSDPLNPAAWQALCGRHQVMKRNYWDESTGKLNAYAIVQAAPRKTKREIYQFLKKYFGEG